MGKVRGGKGPGQPLLERHVAKGHVLDDIVQHAGDDDLVVEAVALQDERHMHRVHDVRDEGSLALLLLVRKGGDDQRPIQDR